MRCFCHLQTDLTGIKWRKLTASTFTVEPLEDPVLVSFSRCMRSDILCAWRRVPRNTPGPLVELGCTKELWIFWYGNEPSNLPSLLSSDLEGKFLRTSTHGSFIGTCPVLLCCNVSLLFLSCCRCFFSFKWTFDHTVLSPVYQGVRSL